MKVESLVIANQHVAVNIFTASRHTARHAMGIGFIRNKLFAYFSLVELFMFLHIICFSKNK